MDVAQGYSPKEWYPEKKSIKEFLTRFGSKVLKPHELAYDKRKACYNLMNSPQINLAQFEHLEKACSIAQLSTTDEEPVVNVAYLKKKPLCFHLEEVDSDLKTHKALKERREKKEKVVNILKHRGDIWTESIKSTVTDMKPMEEVVISVRIFRPFAHKRGSRYRQPPQLQQELLVLGRQSLCELRDVIVCESDGPLMKETSEDPSQKPTLLAKDVYKSGFFFIDGTFYNDHRNAENIDYSAVIRQWASGSKMEFDAKKMEEHKFIDLSVILGYPYVYQHQGDCEHLIVFSDIRLLSGSDNLTSSHYPLLKTVRRMKSRMCMVCGKNRASWLTRQNERLFVHTGYFCEECFISFNYVDGKKVGEFLAYPLSQ